MNGQWFPLEERLLEEESIAKFRSSRARSLGWHPVRHPLVEREPVNFFVEGITPDFIWKIYNGRVFKAGARRAERLRGIKKAAARSGSMPFVSSSPLPVHVAILVTRPTALPRVSKPGNSGSARSWIDAWSLDRLSGPLREAGRIRPIMKFFTMY